MIFLKRFTAVESLHPEFSVTQGVKLALAARLIAIYAID